VWWTSLKIAGLCLILPLLGCAPSINVSLDLANQALIPSTHSDPAPSVQGGELLTADEMRRPSSPHPGIMPVESLPFVRSQPRVVPPFPLVLNRAVQSYIDSYLSQPEGLRQSFQRSDPFMAEMVLLFQNEGLPPELVYLAFAESAFSANGAGPWQLSRTTARRYGLTINQWLDERRDPIKSTRAAANYLAELHDRTGADWRMTLVAWNNGDGGVYRYLQLMTAPYERLMHGLPRHTSSLMNRFMAVALIARHPREYGLHPADWPQVPRYRVIAVEGSTPLRAVAQSNHTTLETLHRLNPALLRDCTPPGPQSYPIRIPDTSTEMKLALSDS
jgi:membrane-bound lytic murein transglycosylase D